MLVETRRTRSELVLESYRQEDAVYCWARSYLKGLQKAKHADSFDLIYQEKRIEVKASRMDQSGLWHFNVHRHGVIKEDGIFAYILRLEGVPGFEHALHLVIPAPLKVYTLVLSLRSLILHWGRFANNLQLIEPSLRKNKTKRLNAERLGILA